MSEKSKRKPIRTPKDKAYALPPESMPASLDPALSDHDFFLDVLIKALAIGEITASQFTVMHLALINPAAAQKVLEGLHITSLGRPA